MSKKSPAQILGSLGGKATARKPLTEKQRAARSENFKKARLKRWAKGDAK